MVNEIIEFLGVEFSFNNRMPKIFANYNVNKYAQYNDANLEEAMDLLRNFYRRPNLEFYK